MLNNYKRHVISSPEEMIKLVEKGVVPWVIDVPIHLESKIKETINKYIIYKNERHWKKERSKNHGHAYLETYLYLTGKYGYEVDSLYDTYFNMKRIKKFPSFCFMLAIQNSLRESKETWDISYIYNILEKGVKLKDPECLYTVGRMYMEGMKYNKNIKKGIKLLSLAAKQNHPGALFLLSNYYSNGILVKQDLKKANKLMEKAKEVGIGNDFYSKHPSFVPFWEFMVSVDPENILFDSILTKVSKLTPNKNVTFTKLSDIAKHYGESHKNVSYKIPMEDRERLFNELKNKVDEFRNNDYPFEYEKYLLGYTNFLNNGYGCKKDPNEIFKTVMDLDFIGSQKHYNIKGVCYELGIGVEKNIELAKEYLLKASEVPSTQAIAFINLSKLFRNKKFGVYDDKLAFDYALKALESGDVRSLIELANCYTYGINVKADEYKAINLFRYGDKLNYLPSLKTLGVSFLYGRGAINKSIRSAIDTLKKCVEKYDDTESMYYLGLAYKGNMQYDLSFECFTKCEKKNLKKVYLELAVAYDLGLGVKKDQSKALHYYSKIEDVESSGTALNNLGVMYKLGKSVPQDYDKAFYYYKKAYELKVNQAYKNLANCYFDGIGTEVNIKRGFEILDEGIKDNASSCYIRYGYFYEKGLYGITVDTKKAFDYYSKAVELNDPDGYYFLAWCYNKGIGCIKSDYNFINYLKLAEKNGYREINYAFGFAYYFGVGVSKDYKEADKYLKKSIENCEGYDANCYGILGHIYESFYKDGYTAFQYYKKAADLDYSYGHLALGTCYFNGIGCIKDLALARVHWKKALELGDNRAKEFLEKYK